MATTYPFIARYLDLNRIKIVLEGEWFKYILGNGLYLSADSSFVESEYVDLYGYDEKLAKNNPPFYGIPIKRYDIINNNVIEFYLNSDLIGANYDIIFCNPAGYVKASSKLSSSVFKIPGVFEYKQFTTISGNTLTTIQNDTVKTIKIKFLYDTDNAINTTINSEELTTITGDNIITLRKYITL